MRDLLARKENDSVVCAVCSVGCAC